MHPFNAVHYSQHSVITRADPVSQSHGFDIYIYANRVVSISLSSLLSSLMDEAATSCERTWEESPGGERGAQRGGAQRRGGERGVADCAEHSAEQNSTGQNSAEATNAKAKNVEAKNAEGRRSRTKAEDR